MSFALRGDTRQDALQTLRPLRQFPAEFTDDHGGPALSPEVTGSQVRCAPFDQTDDQSVSSDDGLHDVLDQPISQGDISVTDLCPRVE